MFFIFIAELAIVMNSYILLRDNKESGPHTLADLRRIGLKSSDLIWIECQSVGWRYPGEINELKELAGQPPVAPVVKEEPAPVENMIEQKAEVHTLNDNHSHIFVKLPEQKTPVSTYQPQERHSEYQPKEFKEPVKPIETSVNNEAEVETKYARSLDEIKEMYVKNMQRRKRKSKLAVRIPKGLARVGTYAALVLVGAVTVYLVMNPGQKMTVIADERPHLPVKFQPRPDTFPNYNSLAAESGSSVNTGDDFSFKADPSITTEEKTKQANTSRKLETEKVDENVEQTETQSATENAEPDHRVTIPKNEEPEFKPVPLSTIADQVSVSTNTYTVAALGGIRNLELTLLNGSGYPLDRVVVELRYLNPSGVILKTQDVQFTSVHPNGTQTIAIKKSNRGVKVAYKVVRIESKGSAYTAGLQ